MPPLPLYPNQPAGQNDINGMAMSQNGYDAGSMRPTSSSLVPATGPDGTIVWVTPEQRDQIAQGFGAYQDENRYRWQTGVDIQKKQLDNQYKVAMLGAQNQQEQLAITREYDEKNYQLAVQAHELATRAQGFSEEMGRGNLALGQANLGYNIAKTGADLAAVNTNPFALADFQRGLGEQPGAIAALQSLESGGQLKPGGSGASGQPQTYTLGGLTQMLMNGAGNAVADGGATLPAGIQSTGNARADANLASANNIAMRGMNKLAPGSLEKLDPLESGVLGSAWKRTGWSTPSLLYQYDQTRAGQGAAGSY